MQNARVIVIGAGISGISCASKLIENGFKNVRILEAENRIGGRVYTVPFASNVLDMGAQWCHGEVNNSVYDLVKDHNVLDASDRLRNYPEVQFLCSTGKNLDQEKCGKLVAFVLAVLHDSEGTMKDVKGSLGNYVITKYKEALKTAEFSDIDEEIAYQVLDYIHKFENSVDATDTWYDSSANGYTHYWECDGHPLLNWRDKGYKHVIDFITRKKPDPTKAIDIESKTILNKEVSNINWCGGNQIVIKCSDGSSYDCEHVVVTCSLGVLKENYSTMFSPQLPKLKTNAIEGLSIGTVDKIYLEFEKPFWDDEWTGMSFLWSQKDSTAIRATPNAWLEDVFGFYIVDHQPNVICGWIGGKSARIMETLDDEKILEGCLYLFDKFIGNKLPWTKPKNIKVSRWNSNRHFRGSYTFRSVTTDFLKTSARDLSLPLHDALGKPVVLFAGEATHDHYYSTVHGALETGRREADRLTNYYAGDFETENCAQKPNSSVPNEIEHFDAIILGAGIAGLGAGEMFRRANLNFLILEGQSRIGGRINTVDLGHQVTVDAGAQWLHGKDNELFNYAKKFDLITPELSEEAEGDYIREDGMKFNEYFVKKIDFKIGQILEECENFVNHKNDANFKFPESIEQFVNEKFKLFVDSLENDDEKKRAMQMLDWHRRFQIIDNSCLHLSEISAKDWGNYSFNGESCQTHINIKNGMENIVKRLNESLNSKILLNKIVELIYWKSEETNKILIKCNDGSVFTTNNLICTFSVGVLKENHRKMFIPPLPSEHGDVIDSIGFGTIDKIFIVFDEQWWDNDWKGLQLIWNEDVDDESHWTKFISGFDVVYPSPKNSLLAWIGGKGAIEMEKLSDKEISDGCMEIIRKFMNKEIPNPSKFFCSRWNSNSLIRGAYSFTAKTTDNIHGWEEILATPIKFKSNTLLFAGEACHPSYFSTVHGAFHSGMEQAEHILKSINNSNPFSNFSKLFK